MFDIARIQGAARRFARTPAQLQHVDDQLEHLDDEIAVLRQEVGILRADIVSLQSALITSIDFAAKSTLEALAFTNRSIEGLNARLDRIGKESDQHLP